MRSQFKPVNATFTSHFERVEPLHAKTRQIQGWLLGLCGLLGAFFLTAVLFILTGERLVTHAATPGELTAVAPLRLIFGGLLALATAYLAFVLGLLWQVWQFVLSLTGHLTHGAASSVGRLLRQARNITVWIRVLQIAPIALTALSLVTAALMDVLIGRLTGEAVRSAAGPGRVGPLDILVNGVSLTLQFFVLESVRRWIHAVSLNARGSKSLLSGHLARLNGWTILCYLSLGFTLLVGLFGAAFMLRFPLYGLIKGRVKMDAADVELFSRLSGLMQGGVLLGLALTVTLLVLLTLLRAYAAQVTGLLDERSAHSRRQGLEDRPVAW